MNIRTHHFASIAVAAAIAIAALPSVARCEGREANESASRIGHLIEALASKNAAPRVEGDARLGDDPEFRFGSDYDKAAQVPVFLAVNQLLAEGEPAFDLLLKHSGDQRYSFSINSYPDYNVTVGQACIRIVYRNILCYEPEIHVITSSQFGLYPPRGQPLDEWWESNKQHGLATLQLEAIDAAVEFMQHVDGKTALPWHPDARRLPIDEFARLREKNLMTLKGMRQTIKATEKPITAKTIDGHATYMFGLPWTGRKYNK